LMISSSPPGAAQMTILATIDEGATADLECWQDTVTGTPAAEVRLSGVMSVTTTNGASSNNNWNPITPT